VKPVATTGPTLVAAMVVTAAELVVAAIAATGTVPLAGALGLHAGLCVVCAYWARRIAAVHGDVSRPLLLLILTIVLGPAGSAGTVFVLVMTAWHSRHTVPFEEWYRALFPDVEQDQQVAAWERIIDEQIGENSGGVPAFADVLAFGTVAQKQSLLALVNRRFRPELGPVLKRALNDADNAIRVQAATAISRLETVFLQDSLRLTRSIAASPDDPAPVLEMARLCDNFAYAGILDGRRTAETRAAALSHYQQYLRMVPGDSEIMLTVARQELRQDHFQEALDLLERAGDAGWTDAAILWRLECLYGLGHLEAARGIAERFQDRLARSERVSAEAADSIRLWAGGATG
jgi:polysaccharide biosynthesis protein PelE